jgi:mannose-6-phosphate isomerase-like protein (cupin superfamily)
MNIRQLHIRESDGIASPDICGASIDLINSGLAGASNISLATIFIDPGKSSKPHYHKITEEIYYFLDGVGRVVIEDQVYNVGPGSAVYLPLHKLHQVLNDSPICLRFLSADSPPFDPTDIYFRE